MRRTILALAGALVLSSTAMASGASATNTSLPRQGCSSAYWASHIYNWPNGPGDGDATYGRYRPARTVSTVFRNTGRFSQTTLRSAVSLRAGDGLEGARAWLVKAGVTAALNADHEGLSFPLRRWDGPLPIIATVNGALASNDEGRIRDLAGRLDRYNNGRCPLGDTVWQRP